MRPHSPQTNILKLNILFHCIWLENRLNSLFLFHFDLFRVFEKFGERISKIWMHSEWLFRYTGMYREQRKCADIVQNEVNRVC